ncbi:MAG TPA: PAC2 family protein [Actinomycetota bacterium]|nr:PAC2 family protein [Actinomycetota bacterium]
MNPYVRLDRRPDLVDGALVVAFQGWNDGGEAATSAARYLVEQWEAVSIGTIDPEEFYDFQVNRPTVRLEGGVSRVIDWPRPELFAASVGGRGVVVLIAPEPNVRWRTFTETILDACRDLGIGLMVTLGGFLTDVAHARPVPVVGSARNEDEAGRLGLAHSRYEGPTGIVGVLHDAANRSGLASVSLWAAVPHYLPMAVNPKAALALVERTSRLLGVPLETEPLAGMAERWERGVARVLEENEELGEYVRRLEAAAEAADEQGLSPEGPVPSGESIAAELERYLQERAGGEGSGP